MFTVAVAASISAAGLAAIFGGPALAVGFAVAAACCAVCAVADWRDDRAIRAYRVTRRLQGQ